MDTSNRSYKYLTLGMMLLLAACSATPTAETPPIPSATPSSQFLFDDFDRSNSGWARFDIETGAAYVQNEEFFLEDKGKDIAVYSPLVGQEYRDIQMSLTVRHVQGSMNNWMGVICRQQDESNYYLLAISADGYYLIQRVVNDAALPLMGPGASAAIHSGKTTNRLEATCQDDQLTLSVNGELIATARDDTLDEAGQVAIFADAVSGGGTTTVAFDNVTLSVP